MANNSIGSHLLKCVLFLYFIIETEARSIRSIISVRHIDDGFALEDLEANKYFSFGIVPQKQNEEMSLSFYDVWFPSNDCGKLSIEIQADGYSKMDYRRVGLICDFESLISFTATSKRGFHIIVRTGDGLSIGGGFKAKFEAPSGHIYTMFLTRSEYDRGVNTFSPEGRLFQVEYAIEAIKLGSTAIGLQTSEGVVLAVEKRVTSPLIEASSIEKIMEVDKHIACAMSGLIADSKTLIDKARVEAQNHWFTYNETMNIESVTQAVSNLALQFGDDDAEKGAMSRPFGVALLFAGVDEKGPRLFHMDPSGTYIKYDAKAIGSGSEGAQQALQEVYHKSMTLKEACKSALTILKQVMEEKLNSTNVEMCTVTPGNLFRMYTKDELENIIKDI